MTIMSVRNSILFGPLPPPYGGVAVFMDAISSHAIERGVKVWTYTGEEVFRGRENPLFVNHRRLCHIRALLASGFHSRVTDSTHFHLEYPNVIALSLWLAIKSVLRFRWIKILHDGSLPERYRSFSRFERWLFRIAVRKVDEFVIYNKDLEDWVCETTGFGGPIRAIPLFLPLPENWSKVDLPARLADSIADFQSHNKRVLTVGFFIPSYGFLDVAEAVQMLRQETGEDIGLLIAAGAGIVDESFKSEVLTGRDWIKVVFDVPNIVIGAIYRQSDVFVRGFAHESFGLSRIEAMACGVPVVATNVGETRGMSLYEFGDIQGLARLIRAALEGEHAVDAEIWTARFQKEAESNLARYLQVIAGENLDSDV